MEKVIIVGSGPAGLTAAIYLARANLHPLVISGPEPGGQLIYTTEVENFPGFDQGVLGPELMIKMRQQAEKFGAKFVGSEVISAEFSQKPYKIVTESESFTAPCIIIASGAKPRTLQLKNENLYLSKGVHTCATCDGAFYKGKKIVVVGGGDSAMTESIFLTKFAEKVFIVHRGQELNASEIMQNRVTKNPKIEVMYNTEVKEYLGDGKIEAVQLMNNKNDQSWELKIDAIFLAIGQIPNSRPFINQLTLDKIGYIEATNNIFTKKEGVFVAGDVADWKYKQAITAAGFGCMAALEAEKYLSSLE